jgi:hypothetical protein
MPRQNVRQWPQLVTILRLETDPGSHMMRIMKLFSLQQALAQSRSALCTV